jgi:hypothetical protein
VGSVQFSPVRRLWHGHSCLCPHRGCWRDLVHPVHAVYFVQLLLRGTGTARLRTRIMRVNELSIESIESMESKESIATPDLGLRTWDLSDLSAPSVLSVPLLLLRTCMSVLQSAVRGDAHPPLRKDAHSQAGGRMSS